MDIAKYKEANSGESALPDNPARAAHLSNMLKALAHPVRLRIIAILCESEAHVNGLAERLGINQAIVSQQLRILRMHGLVAVTRASGFAYYAVAEPQMHQLVKCMSSCSTR